MPLHICFIVYEYLPGIAVPEDLLKELFSLTDWCEALTSLDDCKISAIIRFPKSIFLHIKGVDYHFIKDSHGPRLSFWQIPLHVHRKVKQLAPHILHSHNMNKVIAHAHLLHQLNSRQAFVLQNHAERPRYWLQKVLQRMAFRKVNAFIFTAKGQEKIWTQQKLIDPQKVCFILEASNYFQPADRHLSQQKTGLAGQPIFLWVGNLNSNKDPLTVLAGLADTFTQLPDTQLFMIYRSNDLEAEVRSYIASQPSLKGRVHLLGSKKRERLPAYFNSAHYFLLGSHLEGSGYSALEAIACGCVPILTAIPSYKMITANGKIGQLWPSGDSFALHNAIQKALQQPWEKASTRSRAHFEQFLSYPVIARQMMDVYKKLL